MGIDGKVRNPIALRSMSLLFAPFFRFCEMHLHLSRKRKWKTLLHIRTEAYDPVQKSPAETKGTSKVFFLVEI